MLSTINIHFTYKDTYKLKVNGWRKINCPNTNLKKARVLYQFQTELTLKSENLSGIKKGITKLEKSILQEDLTILNMYVPSKRTSNYVRQKLTKLKGEMGQYTIIAGDFNTPLSEMIRPSRQKTRKDTVELSNTINQWDITDIYRLLQPTTAEYFFFSNSHGTFTKIDHILDHKTYLNKFKGI